MPKATPLAYLDFLVKSPDNTLAMRLKRNVLPQIIFLLHKSKNASLLKKKQASGVGTVDAKTQMNHLTKPPWLLHHLVMESKRDKHEDFFV